MSRARMNGILVTLLAAGSVAGCGGAGDGTIAAQSAPAVSDPAAATTAAATPTPDPTNGVVQAIPAEDPKDAHFKHYDRFPVIGASMILVPPDSVQADPVAATADPTALGSATTGTTVTTGTTGTTTAPTGTNTTASITNVVANVAQAEVDGKPQLLQVNTQLPKANPQFTVSAIDAGKVTLKLISGTFPGGSTTIDIASGASVTLSNPTTGAAIFILVKSILPVAG